MCIDEPRRPVLDLGGSTDNLWLTKSKASSECTPHESCQEAEHPFPSLPGHGISEAASSVLNSVTCFDGSVVTESPWRLPLP